jgi:hypothetical protein
MQERDEIAIRDPDGVPTIGLFREVSEESNAALHSCHSSTELTRFDDRRHGSGGVQRRGRFLRWRRRRSAQERNTFRLRRLNSLEKQLQRIECTLDLPLLELILVGVPVSNIP